MGWKTTAGDPLPESVPNERILALRWKHIACTFEGELEPREGREKVHDN